MHLLANLYLVCLFEEGMVIWFVKICLNNNILTSIINYSINKNVFTLLKINI